ncbi:MAG TPA: cytochrome c3 family protein [Polyangiaceae bacterium]|nr:cytochrome c3 family protein [Polyangiaceae bacterium]
MLIEWLLCAVALVLGAGLLVIRERYASALMVAVAVTAFAGAAATASARRPAPPEPIAQGGEGFVTSNACRSCHPAQYSSWHRSFHRSMTQRAELSAVAAPDLRQGGRLHLETNGRSCELFARAGELWARLPDPGVTAAAPAATYEASFRAAPMRDVRVQLLTGSHHHQAFWVAGARPGELVAVPVVYWIDQGRLIARRDAFLNPPDAPERAVRWNSNCVQCHAVAGAPEHDATLDAFATSAAELGIACEACHGRGEEHVRAMQNPLARYRAHGRAARELAIVNPSELAPARGAEVCGRCHSYFYPKDEEQWWRHGFAQSFAPGQELSHAQLLLSPEVLAAPGSPQLDAAGESLFYRDGTIRVGGREYNGLVRSPCFERGHGTKQLSCTSCHSLHQSEPNDQLDPEKLANRACAQCHESVSQNLAAHTHHAPTSAGSLCYNCHMPHTSYALLGAIRSHRVDVPAFDARTRDKPNACNLCHLEQSEAWAAEHARAWYGSQPSLTLNRAAELAAPSVPAGAVFALAGDAAVRAITAAALGRHESANDAPALRAQLLQQLAHDDYAAVRSIAGRSLTGVSPAAATPPLDAALVSRLLAARDQHPVTIAE